MNESQSRNWEQRKKRGKVSFVLRQGLVTGTLTALFFTIFKWLSNSGNPIWWKESLVFFLLMIPGGFLFSFVMWHVNEFLFRPAKPEIPV